MRRRRRLLLPVLLLLCMITNTAFAGDTEEDSLYRQFKSFIRKHALTGGTFTLTENLVIPEYFSFPVNAVGDFVIDTGDYSLVLGGAYSVLDQENPNISLLITGKGTERPVVSIESGGQLMIGDNMSIQALHGTAVSISGTGKLECNNKKICQVSAGSTGIRNETGIPLEIWNLSVNAGDTGIFSNADVTVYNSNIQGGQTAISCTGDITLTGSTVYPELFPDGGNVSAVGSIAEVPGLSMELPHGITFENAFLPEDILVTYDMKNGGQRQAFVPVVWDMEQYHKGMSDGVPFTLCGVLQNAQVNLENPQEVQAALTISWVEKAELVCEMELVQFNGENNVLITFPKMEGYLGVRMQLSEDGEHWTVKDITSDIPDWNGSLSVRIYDESDTYIRFQIIGSKYHGYSAVQCVNLPETDMEGKDDSIGGNYGQGGAREESGYQSKPKENAGEQTAAAPVGYAQGSSPMIREGSVIVQHGDNTAEKSTTEEYAVETVDKTNLAEEKSGRSNKSSGVFLGIGIVVFVLCVGILNRKSIGERIR